MNKPTPKNSPRSSPSGAPSESLEKELPVPAPVEEKLEELSEKSGELTEAAEERGEETVETVEGTREQLEEAKKNLPGAPAENPVAAEAAEIPAAKKSAEPETWYKPQTWNKETREKAERMTQFALIGTGVVGGLLLLKWLWGKASKTAEAVKEKTSGAWNFLKFATLAGVGTLLAYGGFRGYMKYKETFGRMREIDRTIKDMRSKLEAAKNAPEAVRREMAETIRRLEEEAKELAKPKKKIADQNEKPSTVTEAAEEAAEEVKKFIPEKYFIAMGIARFFGEKKGNLTMREHANQIHDIITNSKNKTLKMSDIIGKNQPFEILGDDRENRAIAGKTVVDFCTSQQDRVLSFVQKRDGIDATAAKEKVNAMSLSDYLNATASSFGTMVPAMETIVEAKGDIASAIEKLDFNNLTAADDMIKEELVEIAKKYGLNEDELKDFSSYDMLQMASTMNGGTVGGKEMMPPDASAEAKVLYKIFEELKSGDTHLYMLPCFHDIFPGAEGDMTDEQKKEFVKECLLDRMSPLQAVRFFLYQRMMKNGNPAGLMLMQLEVLKFIASKESGELVREQKYQLINRIGQTIASKSASEIAEEWQNLNLDIDPELIENAGMVMQQMFEAGVEGAGWSFFGAAAETWSAAWGFAKDNPKVSIPGAAIGTLYARWQYFRGGDAVDIELAMKQFSESFRGQGKLSEWLNKGRPLIGFVSVEDIKNAQSAYANIYKAIDTLPETDQAKDSLFAALRACNNSHGTVKAWKNLQTAIGAHSSLGGSNADEAVKLFTQSAGMRRAVAMMRHPSLSKIPFFQQFTRLVHGGTNKVVDAVEHAPAALSALRNSTFLQEAMKQTGTKLDDLLQVLSKIDVPPAVLEAFAKSKGGLVMLCNAAKSGAPAMEYLMKMGAFATKIGPLLGKAALGIDVIICAVEIAMNRVRIAETDNQSLKELYAMRDRVSVANAAAGTAMGITWFAVGWAPAGAVVSASTFAPAVIALVAAKYSHDRLEEVSETWLSEEKDWAKKTPGELRQRMEALGVGTFNYWQGAAGGSNAEQAYRWFTMTGDEFRKYEEQVGETIETANAGARFHMTRAYLAQMTDMAPKENETKEQFRERFARFQAEQAAYVANATGGQFNLSFSHVYENAHLHAELRALSRELKEKKASQILTIVWVDEYDGTRTEKEFDLAKYGDFTNSSETIDGINAEQVIYGYRQQKRGVTLLQVAFMKEMQKGNADMPHNIDFTLQNNMLMDVRHDLAACDQRLRQEDLNGWKWTGGEDKTRDYVRYVMNVEFRKLLRAESDRLQSKDIATVDDLEESVRQLKAFLAKPAADFVKMGTDNQYGGAAEFAGTSELLADIGWNLQNLYVRPASKKTS